MHPCICMFGSEKPTKNVYLTGETIITNSVNWA